MAQRTMHDFMGERPLEFRGFELTHEGRVIDNPRAVRRHRWQISRYKFQPQAERAEKWLRQQELNPSPGELLCHGGERRLHAALPSLDAGTE